MEMVVSGKEKSEVKPIVLKLAVAAGLSFAGFIVSQLRSRPRHLLPSSNDELNGEFKEEELCIQRNVREEETLGEVVHNNGITATSTTIATTETATALVGLSPTSRSSGNEEKLLLPEFNNMVIDEFEASGKELERAACATLVENWWFERNAMEQEIVELKNLVFSLQEREESLKLQLLEYYGLKEQQASVRELENQLKVNMVEAKLHSLKIEALEDENQKLRAQLDDYSKVVTELDAAKEKIKLLKKKLKSDNEQRKEQLAFLYQRIDMLQTRERNGLEDEADIDRRLKNLEDEATELKILNSQLVGEKSNLAKKLEPKQSDTVNDQGAELSEELICLRQMNEKLLKDIEQLRTDRCTDVEELVYLRWVNACLRHELRNYRPPSGKTVARDLNKSSSPTSEEKAKQLILEYASPSADEKSLDLRDLDSVCSSPDFGIEHDGISIETSSSVMRGGSKKSDSGNRKPKFLHKLKKLVLGKESQSSKELIHSRILTKCGNSERRASISTSERRASISTCSIADTIGVDSYGSFSSCATEEFGLGHQLTARDSFADERCSQIDTRYHDHSRNSLDSQVSPIFDMEGDEKAKLVPHLYKRLMDKDNGFIDFSPDKFLDPEDVDAPEKVELKKFATALKKSRGKINRRSASLSNIN